MRCIECSTEFKPFVFNQRFCKPKCSGKYHNRMNRIKLKESKDKIRDSIPEVYPIEYINRKIYVKKELGEGMSNRLGLAIRTIKGKQLEQESIDIKRIDNMKRSIKVKTIYTSDLYDLIQDRHTKYRDTLDMNSKRSRDEYIKILKGLQ